MNRNPRFTLLVQNGPQAGKVFNLEDGRYFIGRDPANEIQIQEPAVSNKHAVIQVQPEGTWIQDLRSSNGTWINGQRVRKSVWLKPGDNLQIGTTINLQFNHLSLESTQTQATLVPGGADVPAYTLVIQSGIQRGLSYPLKMGDNSIGRESGNDIIITEDTISRDHARITVGEEGVWIEDLNSSNGTFVNGQRIATPTWLNPSVSIQLGTSVVLGLRALSPQQTHPPARVAPTPATPLRKTSPVPKVRQAKSKIRKTLNRKWGIMGLAILLIFGALFLWPFQKAEAILDGPMIVINEPINASDVGLDVPLVISAEVRDPLGVARVELWVDGVFVGAQHIDGEEQISIYSFFANWIPEAEGPHDILLRAYNTEAKLNQSQVVRVVAGDLTYIAQPGDTLDHVAETTNVPVDDILDANPQLVSPRVFGDYLLASVVDTSLGEDAQPYDVVYSSGQADTWENITEAQENLPEMLPSSVEIVEVYEWDTSDHRDPQPNEKIKLPGQVASTEDMETNLNDDDSHLPPKAQDAVALRSRDCSFVSLQWRVSQPSDISETRIYAQAPGSAHLDLLEVNSADENEFTFDLPLAGVWTFFIGTRNAQGTENLSRVVHDSANCQPLDFSVDVTLPESVELQITRIDSPASRLYCYIQGNSGNIESQYQRIPADMTKFLYPTDRPLIIDASSRSFTLVKPAPKSAAEIAANYELSRTSSGGPAWELRNRVAEQPNHAAFYALPNQPITANLTCLGWQDDTLSELGSQEVNHPWEQLDGRTHSVQIGETTFEYVLLPTQWLNFNGERQLDENFAVPTNLRNGKTTRVLNASTGKKESHPTLAWDWEPAEGQSETSVAGYQVILREYAADGSFREMIIDAVSDPKRRSSTAFPDNDKLGCDRGYELYVRAVGHGPFISGYSQPYALPQRPCTDAEIRQISKYAIEYGQTKSGRFSPDLAAVYQNIQAWVFEGSTGDQVEIAFDADSPVKVWVQPLANSAQWVQFEAHEDRAKAGLFTIPELPARGRYAIFIKLAQGENNASYQISLNQLNPPPTVQTVVIFIHGVANKHKDTAKPDNGYQGLREKFCISQDDCIKKGYDKTDAVRWFRNNKDQGDIYVIDFYCCNMSFPDASGSVGTRAITDLDLLPTGELFGMSNAAWWGAAKLKEVVARTRNIFGYQVPITVISHSQGTVITTAALQDGMVIDNWILLGSPLNYEAVMTGRWLSIAPFISGFTLGSLNPDLEHANTRLGAAAANVKRKVINLWSYEDQVVGVLKLGIGGWGMPPKIYGYKTENIDSIQVTAVDHFGGEGWWSGVWLYDGRTFKNASSLFYGNSIGILTDLLGISLDVPASSPFNVLQTVPENTNEEARNAVLSAIKSGHTTLVTPEQIESFHLLQDYALANRLGTWGGALIAVNNYSQDIVDTLGDYMSSTILLDIDADYLWFFNHDRDFNEAAVNFHITPGMSTGIHFDDKDWVSYRVNCQSGMVDVQVQEAVWFTFDHYSKLQTAKPGSPASGCIKTSSNKYDATFYVEMTGKSNNVSFCSLEMRGRDDDPLKVKTSGNKWKPWTWRIERVETPPDGCEEPDKR